MDARVAASSTTAGGKSGIDAAAWVIRVRLATGLVLFAYVLTHLLNHALGIVSLDVLIAVQNVFCAVWGNWPMTGLLLASALTHGGLALWSIWRRRELRMQRWEACQLGLGLLIPPVLVDHVIGTRVAAEMYGVWTDYTYVLWVFGMYPVRALVQAGFLVLTWTHGCVGLHFWLRIRPRYQRTQELWLLAYVLVPVLALVGFYVALREVNQLAADPDWLRSAIERMHLPQDRGAFPRLLALRDQIWIGLALLLVGVLAGRGVRRLVERGRGMVRLTYHPGGRLVTAAQGLTVLEASRGAGIPHASVCGGRGRCSTCRVRVGPGGEKLPPPSSEETRVLKRVGASEHVRLACQIRPLDDLELTPLLPPDINPVNIRTGDYHSGREIEIAVLFADLRGFTSLSQHRLPFDTVFLLNRYFAEMGKAIESAGGHLDKFIGDGIMALFGLRDGPRWGAIGALTAAQRMGERLEQLNRDLASDLVQPLRIGIGIHTGPVIVGDMGYGEATQLTAIGDVVNTASRLESLTKEHKAILITSGDTATLADLKVEGLDHHELLIRGRDQSTPMYVVTAQQLAGLEFTQDRRHAIRERATRRAEPSPDKAAAE